MEKVPVKVSPRTRCVRRRERGQGENTQLKGTPLITKCYINFKSPEEIFSL